RQGTRPVLRFEPEGAARGNQFVVQFRTRAWWSIGFARRGKPGGVQLGLDARSGALVQLPVVNADLRQVAVEARSSSRPRPADPQGRDGRVGRDGPDGLVRAGGQPVAVQGGAAIAPGDADDLEISPALAGVDDVAGLAVVAQNGVQA